MKRCPISQITRKMQIKNYNEVSPYNGHNGHHPKKNLQTINAGEDVERKEPSHCWWECKMIQPLWRTV